MNQDIEAMHALADGELSAEEELQARRLLDESEEARAEYAWAKGCRRLLGQRCAQPEASDAWMRTRERIAELDRTRTTERFVGRHAWIMAGFLLCTLLAAAFVQRIAGGGQLTSANMAGLFSASNVQPLQVSNGPGGLPELIQRTLGIDGGQVVEMPAYFQIAAVGSTRLEGRPAMRLIIEDQSGPFAVFLLQGVQGVQGFEPIQGSDYRVGNVFDKACVAWTEGDALVLITAPRSIERLVQTAELLRTAQPLP